MSPLRWPQLCSRKGRSGGLAENRSSLNVSLISRKSLSTVVVAVETEDWSVTRDKATEGSVRRVPDVRESAKERQAGGARRKVCNAWQSTKEKCDGGQNQDQCDNHSKPSRNQWSSFLTLKYNQRRMRRANILQVTCLSLSSGHECELANFVISNWQPAVIPSRVHTRRRSNQCSRLSFARTSSDRKIVR